LDFCPFLRHGDRLKVVCAYPYGQTLLVPSACPFPPYFAPSFPPFRGIFSSAFLSAPARPIPFPWLFSFIFFFCLSPMVHLCHHDIPRSVPFFFSLHNWFLFFYTGSSFFLAIPLVPLSFFSPLLGFFFLDRQYPQLAFWLTSHPLAFSRIPTPLSFLSCGFPS